MTVDQWLTLILVVGAIALFASEKLRIDLVALIVLVLLVVLKLVSPVEALAGFSNEATITVAAMFALSLGIERSGALNRWAHAVADQETVVADPRLDAGDCPDGAFVKNIALVARPSCRWPCASVQIPAPRLRACCCRWPTPRRWAVSAP
jgi:hypothetical protein